MLDKFIGQKVGQKTVSLLRNFKDKFYVQSGTLLNKILTVFMIIFCHLLDSLIIPSSLST